MPPVSAAKQAQLQEQFKKYDRSGDGKLDFKEMSVLLRRGNPGLAEAQLRSLFNAVDVNHDGRIDFGEFVAYIYNTEEAEESSAPEAPEDVETVFHAFAGGLVMDGMKFAKLCRDCNLIGASLAARDVDMIFARVAPRARKTLDYPAFLKALSAIAHRKNLDIRDLYGQVGDAIPINRGTKGDAVRLHDDTSTYTGTRRSTALTLGGHRQSPAASPRPGSRGPGSPERSVHGARGRAPGQRASDTALPSIPRPSPADTSGEAAVPEDKLDWNLLSDAFFDYSGKSDDMDGREFAKLCSDCGLYCKKFSKRDVDIVFQKVLFKGERRMLFGQFIDALKIVAQRKEVAPYFVHKAVLKSEGPVLHGTRPGAVRLHDDKALYTGTHAFG